MPGSHSGGCPAAINSKVVAVGQDEDGYLTVGASNRLDAGQLARARALNIRVVPPVDDLHAEEELT